ncbi:eukaryotic translation initiation factor 3 subunit H [Ditylenchus destructor]|nr:eukaryotic translation initiation factor 3 subunit H [Ditylenchus destructor]
MATIVPLATIPLADTKVDKVQIDSLVVMKIVKHVDIEFYSGMSEVAGETCQVALSVPTRGLRPLERSFHAFQWLCQCQLAAFGRSKGVFMLFSGFVSANSRPSAALTLCILTGLISPDDRRLEVTNCFPTPRPETLLEGDENNPAAVSAADDKNTEILDMLKRFR